MFIILIFRAGRGNVGVLGDAGYQYQNGRWSDDAVSEVEKAGLVMRRAGQQEAR